LEEVVEEPEPERWVVVVAAAVTVTAQQMWVVPEAMTVLEIVSRLQEFQ
jgi:hypothetical protein